MKKTILLFLVIVLSGCQNGLTESKRERFNKATDYALEAEISKSH